MSDIKEEKHRIRQRIWRLLEERGVARFPLPVTGRIPNFQGAEVAAERLAQLAEFSRARVVKVNPDSPQKPVRLRALLLGKKVIMPSPRLRRGFILLDPACIPRYAYPAAATIRGAFRYGRELSVDEIPHVDLIVVGSVAVAPNGARLGKGGGYSELEYGILRSLERIHADTPVATTVHDLQIVDELPQEPHDVAVDIIVTPTRVLRVANARKPPGILWERASQEMFEQMPILKELRERVGKRL